MGIGGTIATKIGIPVALLAVAGFVLFTFKDRILSSVQGGASVLGQAFSSPIGSFLEGINKGFGSIPDIITIPFPKFEFTFGGASGSGGSGGNDLDNPSGQGGIGGSSGILDPSDPKAFEKALENLRNNSLGILDFTKLFGFGSAEGSQLTVLNPSQKLPIDTGMGRKFLSRSDITKQFPNAIGLFDLLDTPEVEFFPFTAKQAELSGNKGFGGIKLSGQIFKELTNDTIF